jgi:hypothetical protein
MSFSNSGSSLLQATAARPWMATDRQRRCIAFGRYCQSATSASPHLPTLQTFLKPIPTNAHWNYIFFYKNFRGPSRSIPRSLCQRDEQRYGPYRGPGQTRESEHCLARPRASMRYSRARRQHSSNFPVLTYIYVILKQMVVSTDFTGKRPQRGL